MLPTDLPQPVDDGAADHLRRMRLPPGLRLRATTGETIDFAERSTGRHLVNAYPRTGRPGEAPLTPAWDQIPGAGGCSKEACSFRDNHAEIRAAGADVLRLSTQDPDYQRKAAERLRLTFPLVSDADLHLTEALSLPTFEAGGQTLLRRLTLVVRDGVVEHVVPGVSARRPRRAGARLAPGTRVGPRARANPAYRLPTRSRSPMEETVTGDALGPLVVSGTNPRYFTVARRGQPTGRAVY
jgi:peroxiredoxin